MVVYFALVHGRILLLASSHGGSPSCGKAVVIFRRSTWASVLFWRKFVGNSATAHRPDIQTRPARGSSQSRFWRPSTPHKQEEFRCCIQSRSHDQCLNAIRNAHTDPKVGSRRVPDCSSPIGQAPAMPSRGVYGTCRGGTWLDGGAARGTMSLVFALALAVWRASRAAGLLEHGRLLIRRRPLLGGGDR